MTWERRNGIDAYCSKCNKYYIWDDVEGEEDGKYIVGPGSPDTQPAPSLDSALEYRSH